MQAKPLFYSQVAKQDRTWLNQFASSALKLDVDKVPKYTSHFLLSELLKCHAISPDPPPETKTETETQPKSTEQVPQKRKSRKNRPKVAQEVKVLPALQPLLETGTNVTKVMLEIKKDTNAFSFQPSPTANLLKTGTEAKTNNLYTILNEWYNKEILPKLTWFENKTNHYLKTMETQLFIEEKLKQNHSTLDEFDLQAITFDFRRQKLEYEGLLRETEEEMERVKNQLQFSDSLKQYSISSELYQFFEEKRNMQLHYVDQLKKIHDSILNQQTKTQKIPIN